MFGLKSRCPSIIAAKSLQVVSIAWKCSCCHNKFWVEHSIWARVTVVLTCSHPWTRFLSIGIFDKNSDVVGDFKSSQVSLTKSPMSAVLPDVMIIEPGWSTSNSNKHEVNVQICQVILCCLCFVRILFSSCHTWHSYSNHEQVLDHLISALL